jgi:hypothetical protein
MKGKGLSLVELGVLRCLVTSQTTDAQMQGQEDGERGGISAEVVSKAMSVGFTAQIINEDEYELEGVLENWIEFLLHHKIDGETRYSTVSIITASAIGKGGNSMQVKLLKKR